MIHRAIQVMRFQLRENLYSARILLVFLLISVFVFSTVQPVNDFAAAHGLRVTPWAFPLLCNDYICQLVIMSGAVILFSNAPFESMLHTYILPRSGHFSWVLGNTLYIAAISLLYVSLIALISLLTVLPHIALSNDWGTVWKAMTSIEYRYEYSLTLTINSFITGHYSPLPTLLKSFALDWGCCVFLGMVSYCVNLGSKSMLGSLMAGGFVMLDIAVANAWWPWFFHVSPVTMTQLSALASARSSYGLTESYAVVFFACGIIGLLSMLIIIEGKKRRRRHE